MLGVTAWAGVMTILAALPLASGTDRRQPVPIRPEVARQLAATDDGESTLVLVSGTTTGAAAEAARAAGLTVVEELDRIDVVAAGGPANAVRAVHEQPGVLRVDANPAVERVDDVAHRATGVAHLRNARAYPELRSLRRGGRTPYDGKGVGIAVIDDGFDTTHEQFVKDGRTKFDAHLRQACPLYRELVLYFAGSDPSPECSAWVPAPENDAGAPSSGHGTVVASAAAGYPRTTASGARVSGTAPGARLFGLETGLGGAMYNVTSALHWVLEHHVDPCGDRSCPSIRVVNNSYALPADDDVAVRRFDPESPFGRIASALVRAGVVVVFANGNDGGDGRTAQTNYFALNPTPGFLSVGSYSDGNAGDRDVGVSSFSSRGGRGDRSTYPDVIAPGALITTACSPASADCVASPNDGDSYGVFNGTSVSAPFVAGAVAQMLQADPSLTPREVEDVLEDTAYQGFLPKNTLEPDRYRDDAGTGRGNQNHRTSFDAGHGLIDVARALSRVLSRDPLTTKNACRSRAAETTIVDPTGDVAVPWNGNPAGAGRDIERVEASLLDRPGALTVVITYADLPDVEPQMHTTVGLIVDGATAEVDLDRSPGSDAFTVFTGPVEVEGRVDPERDTATFLIRRSGGPIRRRASVYWAWTSNTTAMIADVDHTRGGCPIWVSRKTA